MAVTSLIYGKVFLQVFDKEIDWLADNITVGLITAAVGTSEQDDDDYWDDVVSTEVSGTGYPNGDANVLQDRTSTYTGGSNTFALGGADITWGTSTITARTAVIYDATPASNATRPLICFVDAGTNISTTAGTFTVQWHSDGIVKIVVT